MFFVPWTISVLFYSALHWTYPKDLVEVERREEEEAELRFSKKPGMEEEGTPWEKHALLGRRAKPPVYGAG